MVKSGDCDLILLDEINTAPHYDYLSRETVIDTLKTRSNCGSVAFTGRDVKPELCEHTDIMSDMREVKHPLKTGIKAQRGIDF